MREFCREHGITSITIDGEEYKNLAAVNEYSTYYFGVCVLTKERRDSSTLQTGKNKEKKGT